MKTNLKTLSVLFLLIAGMGFGQKSTNEKPVVVFEEILRPSTGLDSNDFAADSQSDILKLKYDIVFHCSKVNNLQTGSCVFSVNMDNDVQSAYLDVGESFPSILSKDKKYLIVPKYIQYKPIPNRPNYAKIKVKFSVFKNHTSKNKRR